MPTRRTDTCHVSQVGLIHASARPDLRRRLARNALDAAAGGLCLPHRRRLSGSFLHLLPRQGEHSQRLLCAFSTAALCVLFSDHPALPPRVKACNAQDKTLSVGVLKKGSADLVWLSCKFGASLRCLLLSRLLACSSRLLAELQVWRLPQRHGLQGELFIPAVNSLSNPCCSLLK